MAKLELLQIFYFVLLYAELFVELRVLSDQLCAVIRVLFLTVNFYIQTSWVIKENLSESVPNRLNSGASVGSDRFFSWIKEVVLVFDLTPISCRFPNQTCVTLQDLVYDWISGRLKLLLGRHPLISLFQKVVYSSFQVVGTLVRRLNTELKVEDISIVCYVGRY